MACSVDVEDVGFTRAEMFSQPLAGTVDRYLYQYLLVDMSTSALLGLD
jgi:hypothetical protein